MEGKEFYFFGFVTFGVAGIGFTINGISQYRNWALWKSIPKYSLHEDDLKSILHVHQKNNPKLSGIYCRVQGRVIAQSYMIAPVS